LSEAKTHHGPSSRLKPRSARSAALRLNDKVEAADAVSGRLTTHLLDTHGGRPAEGVALTLCELYDNGSRRLIVSTVTNHDPTRR
jgi:2-oxo-4-hydroxy-4-carboxy-5-ureidoimidazoline decarboxylase